MSLLSQSIANSTGARLPRSSGVFGGAVSVHKLRSGEILVRSGRDIFRLDVMAYAHVSLAHLEQGRWALVGRRVASAGEEAVLATFASEREAINALKKVHAVMSASWVGFAAKLLLLAIVVWLVLGWAAAVGQAGGPDAASASALGGGASPYPGQFVPNEQSMDDIASGAYRPNISLRAPEVKLPELACAAPGGK